MSNEEEAIDAICAIVDGYQWLAEGRGPYAYDDMRYDDDVATFTRQLLEVLPNARWQPAVSTFSRLTGRVAKLEQALAAAQHAQREAEAERDSIQHREIVAAQAEFNAMRDRAEAAEAALSRGQEVHSKRYGVLAGEIADLRTSERDLKAALSRARETLERFANPKPDEYDAFGFVAHLRDEARAALEATQLRATQRETDAETAPD